MMHDLFSNNVILVRTDNKKKYGEGNQNNAVNDWSQVAVMKIERKAKDNFDPFDFNEN